MTDGWFISPNGQRGEASRWKGCYRRGLPRPVYIYCLLYVLLQIQINIDSLHDEGFAVGAYENKHTYKMH